MKSLSLGILSLIVFPLVCSPTFAAVFYDTFDYNAWNTAGGSSPAMTDVWTQQNGTNPTIIKSTATYVNFDTPYLNMKAGVISASLGQTLTSDFSLSVNGLHLTDGRSFWIGLFNNAGTQGYGLRWEAYAAGGGSLRMVRFDNATLAGNLSFSTTPGSSALYVGGPIGRPGQPADSTSGGVEAARFIQVGVSWIAATKELTLSIGGTSIGSVTLESGAFTDFSKIYIGASADVAIGDVTVTSLSEIPEPANASVIAACGASLLAFSRCGARRR